MFPFLHHHYSAYNAFCLRDTSSVIPSWCSNWLPSIYAHVQSHYWNVGFLRYWTLQQLPNFIISLPPLVMLFSFSTFHLRLTYAQTKLNQSEAQPKHRDFHTTFLFPSITPHAIHAFILSSTVLFASHTQIILRLAPSMPILYWGVAWLLVNRGTENWGRVWVGWSVIWGAISLVLWTTFLPPA